MPNQLEQLDLVFQALTDGTRRAVLKRLSRGPASVSNLAKPFDMALPSFMQHLSVLENCKLVRSEKSGRVRVYYLTPQPLEAAEGWLERQRTLWETRLDQMDAYLLELKEKEK
ncbi:MAG: helix-turn-helix transcriptional regulator [Spirochaetales bacterium]|nr:helix-turn-helix transcriptional regulator [Spirochaetales bacterium]